MRDVISEKFVVNHLPIADISDIINAIFIQTRDLTSAKPVEKTFALQNGLCEFCDLAFNRAANLRTQSRIREKRYRWEICSVSYSDAVSLISHVHAQ